MELLWNPNYTLFLRGPSCKIVYDSVISKVKLVLLTLGIPNQSQLDCIINSITNFTVKNIHPIQSKFMPRSAKRSVSTGLPVMFPVLFLVFHDPVKPLRKHLQVKLWFGYSQRLLELQDDLSAEQHLDWGSHH